MRLQILIDQYKHFLEFLVSTETMRAGLDELPNDMTLTVSLERDQPGGMIKDGRVVLTPPQSPKTVAGRKEELDRDIQILKARVRSIKEEIIKELQKDEKEETKEKEEKEN